jgi:hypothetical protein
MIYAIALGALVVVGIITTAIIDAVRNNQGAADIRAKAGVTNTLKLTGTVESVDEAAGTISVSDVQFDPSSRSGKAVNYGTWNVIPPSSFNLLSATPGTKVAFTVNSDSFDVASKQVVAAQVTVLK